MAEIHPFRGWRYDVSQVGNLGDVIAPPYDVIDAAGQKALYEKHPCNVVRLILNREEPGDAGTDDRYGRAAEFLRHWKSEGILTQERDAALYVYHQEFDWEGTRYLRKGFLGAVDLEEFGQGSIYAHEETMSGPKADRLALTKACRMNLSPIFGLYPDPDASAQTPMEEAIAGQTPLEVHDEAGVIHRFWPVSDYAAVSAARQAIQGNPIFIADGHHRYETACNYRSFLQAEGETVDASHPANSVLMMLVGMSDPGLAILPTHRLISGLPPLTAADVADAVSSCFAVETVGTGPDAARQAWEMMEADGGQDVFGFGTAADGVWSFARLTDTTRMDALAAEHGEDWRALGVSVLHRLVLDTLIAEKAAGEAPSCRYVHLMDEVTEAVAAGDCQLACLVAPAGIDHVQRIASRFERMPPKSTFFYPKLLSGLVLKPLSAE